MHGERREIRTALECLAQRGYERGGGSDDEGGPWWPQELEGDGSGWTKVAVDVGSAVYEVECRDRDVDAVAAQVAEIEARYAEAFLKGEGVWRRNAVSGWGTADFGGL